MQVCVPTVKTFTEVPLGNAAFVIVHQSSPLHVLPDSVGASIKQLLSTRPHTAPSTVHFTAVRRYLTTVVCEAAPPPHTSARFVLAQFMASEIVMSVELVAYLWVPPTPFNKCDRRIQPLFALQHPAHTLPDLLSSCVRTSTPMATCSCPTGDVLVTYVHEDAFLCAMEKLKDCPTLVEGISTTTSPAACLPPYRWCRTPLISATKQAKHPTTSSKSRAKDAQEKLPPLPRDASLSTAATGLPQTATAAVSSEHVLQTASGPTPPAPIEDANQKEVVPTVSTPIASQWTYKTPIDTLVSTIVDAHAELSAFQRARIDLLSKVADEQFISVEFANFSLLECQPDFFASQPAVPELILRCRGKPVTGALLKDAFPRTISLSGVVPWAACHDDEALKMVDEAHCEALESIGIPDTTDGTQLRLTQTAFLISKSLPADQVHESGVSISTGLLGNMLAESLAHLKVTAITTLKKIELYKQLATKLLTLPRSITRTSIRKQIKANGGHGFRSLVSVIEFENNEAALLHALSVTALNTVVLQEHATFSTPSSPARNNNSTVLIAATFANSIILTGIVASNDESGDTVNVASRTLRSRMPKMFHDVTAIWAPEFGADVFTAISPDFATINPCLASIVTACSDTNAPPASNQSTPAQRCRDLGVAVVAAAAAILWRVAETLPRLEHMPTTTPEFAEAKTKINDCAKTFDDVCECALAAILVDPKESGNLPATLLACQVSVVGNLQRAISTGPDTMRGRKAKQSLAFFTRNLESVQGGTDLLQKSLPPTSVMGRLLATRSSLYAVRKEFIFTRHCLNTGLLERLMKSLPFPNLVYPTLTVMKVVEGCGWDSPQGIAY